jgi:PqqA peptide cyclase
MPSREQVERAVAVVEELRAHHHGHIVIDAVVPDYYARYPKPSVGGWGRRSLNVTPAGKVLPCHAAESIAGLEFWNVLERSLANIWVNSPAFNAFRGTARMKEPCASCPRHELDFGGCRCQAFALTGDATATEPVCHLARITRGFRSSPHPEPISPMTTAACERVRRAQKTHADVQRQDPVKRRRSD